MEQVRVIVEHVADLPGDLPAIWESTLVGEEIEVRLYLRDGLPLPLADHYRCQAVRSVMAEESFDAFTVTPAAVRIVRAA